MKSYTPSKAVREAERELREIIGAINAQKRKLRAVARRLRKAASSAEEAWTIGEDRYTVEDWLAGSIEDGAKGNIDLPDVWTTGAAARRNLLEHLEWTRQRELEHELKATIEGATIRLREALAADDIEETLAVARTIEQVRVPAGLRLDPDVAAQLEQANALALVAGLAAARIEQTSGQPRTTAASPSAT